VREPEGPVSAFFFDARREKEEAAVIAHRRPGPVPSASVRREENRLGFSVPIGRNREPCVPAALRDADGVVDHPRTKAAPVRTSPVHVSLNSQSVRAGESATA
jgi:hypothetical protein